MFYVKIHRTEDKVMLAVCDEDLLGKKFVSDGLKLDISERFYKGEKKDEKYIRKIMLDFGNANLVGEKTIALAVELGLIDGENVLYVDKIPYAMVLEI